MSITLSDLCLCHGKFPCPDKDKGEENQDSKEIRDWLDEMDKWEPCYETQEKLIALCRKLLDFTLTTAGEGRDYEAIKALKVIEECEKIVREK